MKSKGILTLGIITGFLLGSKAGPKPWNTFVAGIKRLRRTQIVSRPIESAADHVSNAVRRKGVQISDSVADAVHRSIVGNNPVVIEAQVTGKNAAEEIA